MNSHERIITTLNHERPDRIGTFDSYWPEFEVICRDRLGICSDLPLDEYFGIDISIAYPD